VFAERDVEEYMADARGVESSGGVNVPGKWHELTELTGGDQRRKGIRSNVLLGRHHAAAVRELLRGAANLGRLERSGADRADAGVDARW